MEFLRGILPYLPWVAYAAGAILIFAGTWDLWTMNRDLQRIWDHRQMAETGEIQARVTVLSAQRITYALICVCGLLLLIFGRLLQL